MRLMRLNPSANVADYIRRLAKRYGIRDAGLVADIFALFRFSGAGLPDETRVMALVQAYATKLSQSPAMVGLVVRKRLIALRNVVALPIFPALLDTGADPLDATEKVLQLSSDIHAKRQAFQCSACAYRTACKFNKTYGNLVSDITVVRDKDYRSLVHPDCPALPDLDFVNSLAEAREFFDTIADPTNAGEAAVSDATDGSTTIAAAADPVAQFSSIAANMGGQDVDTSPSVVPDSVEAIEDMEEFAPVNASGGFGRGSSAMHYRFDGKHCVHVCENLVANISSANLAVYEIARKLDFLLDKHTKGKFKPTEMPGKDKTQATITRLSDAPKVVASEHALDDDTFTTRLVRKSLSKRQDRNPEEKRALLYVLLDASGSMYSPVSTKMRFINRFNLGRVFTLSLARRISQDKGMMYWRAFSDNAGRRFDLTAADEFMSFSKKVSVFSPAGGGTNIAHCLSVTFDDILNAKDNLAKAEILLITDAEDQLSETNLKAQLSRWPSNILHVLDVSAKSRVYGNASTVLKTIANKYYYVDPTVGLDLEKLVKLI